MLPGIRQYWAKTSISHHSGTTHSKVPSPDRSRLQRYDYFAVQTDLCLSALRFCRGVRSGGPISTLSQDLGLTRSIRYRHKSLHRSSGSSQRQILSGNKGRSWRNLGRPLCRPRNWPREISMLGSLAGLHLANVHSPTLFGLLSPFFHVTLVSSAEYLVFSGLLFRSPGLGHLHSVHLQAPRSD